MPEQSHLVGIRKGQRELRSCFQFKLTLPERLAGPSVLQHTAAWQSQRHSHKLFWQTFTPAPGKLLSQCQAKANTTARQPKICVFCETVTKKLTIRSSTMAASFGHLVGPCGILNCMIGFHQKPHGRRGYRLFAAACHIK